MSSPMTSGGLRRLLRRLAGSETAAAAVEFAFIAPVLITILFGGVEVTQLYARYKRVALATRTLADLTSQYITMSASDFDVVFSTPTQIMAPYSTTGVTEILTEIQVDATGKATVVWSKSLNATAYTVGSTVAIPVQMKLTPGYFIWSQLSYPFQPLYSFIYNNNITLSDQIYMGPRNAYQVQLSS